MYIADQARETPDKPAMIIAETGAMITYRELDERSNQVAQYLYAKGLRRTDHIAILMENNIRFMEIVWAAFRSGLYVTAVNRYLPPDDAAYVVNDCMAKAIFSSYDRREIAGAIADLIPNCPIRLMVDGTVDGCLREAYETAVATCPKTPLEQAVDGATRCSIRPAPPGGPKGISAADAGAHHRRGFLRCARAPIATGFRRTRLYLSPAPLYHAAPLGYVTNTMGYGGTVVMMQHFDAEAALRFIDQYKVTHSQWVPTMFVRMLKLDPAARAAHDLSSHQVAIHAAAPCPVDVKRQMIAWWGPIIHEYYAGTEGTGATIIDSEDWLKHPGSVGRPSLGILHICDEDGTELPIGEAGLVYFEREAMTFAYHNDPAKTRAAQHPQHDNWMSLGDVGYADVDADGYLYLTDRKAFMIISGGVNIYPQAIEDALIHPPKGGRRGGVRGAQRGNGRGGEGGNRARTGYRAH